MVEKTNSRRGGAERAEAEVIDFERAVDSRVEQLMELGATGKAFSVLEAVTASPQPTPMAEILRFTGMTKPTAHRVVNSLVEIGFLERDPTGLGFIEGINLVDLAHRTLTAAAPRGIRHTILKALSNHVGETTNYGILSGAEVIYLDRVEAKWPLGLRFDAGSRVPAHCTAIGKLLLSRLSEEELAAMLKTLTLTRYTANSMTSAKRLKKALEEIRETDIGIDNQEFMDGVVCVAVPVTLPDGRCLGGIAMSAPEARMTLEAALDFVPKMREAAERLASTYLPRS